MQELYRNIVDSSWLEWVAVISGLISVWYARKENILVYPVGIVNVLIFVYLCLKAGLYAEMGINLFYFIMSVYGWIVWSRRDQNQKVIPISSCSRLYHLFNLVALIVCFLVLWWVLAFYTDSTVPVADALTTSLFLVAMWLMARKKIENWIYYIIGNLISIPMYAYKGLALSGIQFFVFLILAVMGYLEWKKRLACATQP